MIREIAERPIQRIKNKSILSVSKRIKVAVYLGIFNYMFFVNYLYYL